MFASRTVDAESQFPPDFDALGYQVTAHGKLVSKHGSPYAYKSSRNDRNNEIYQEALQQAARQYVKRQLEEHYNIKPVRLVGNSIDGNNTPRPHVPILATDLAQLMTKDAIVLICGQSDNEAGILSRYGVTDERGIDASSVLDTIAHVCMTTRMHDFKHKTTVTHEYIKEDYADMQDRIHDQRYPGVIILNPGELIYSTVSNTTSSYRSWFARPMMKGQSESYPISDKHNFVAGHKNAAQHVETFFTRILQQMVKENVKIFIIAIGDGAEHVVNAIDSILTQDPQDTLASQLGRTTLIAPTHKHNQLKSEILKTHLASAAVAWELSDVSKGKLLKIPLRTPARFDSNGLCISDRPHAASIPMPDRFRPRRCDPLTAFDIAEQMRIDTNESSSDIGRSPSKIPANPASLFPTPVHIPYQGSDASLAASSLLSTSVSKPDSIDRGVFDIDMTPPKVDKGKKAVERNERGQREERGRARSAPEVRRERTTGWVYGPSNEGLVKPKVSGDDMNEDSFRSTTDSDTPPSLVQDTGSNTTSSLPKTVEGWNDDRVGIAREFYNPATARVQMGNDDSASTPSSGFAPPSLAAAPPSVALTPSDVGPSSSRAWSTAESSVAAPVNPDYLNHPDPRYAGVFKEFDGKLEWTADPTREYPTTQFHREWAELDENVSCHTLSAGKEVEFENWILPTILPSIMMDIDDLRNNRF